MSGLRCRACDEPVWTAKVSGRRLSGKLGEIYKVAAGKLCILELGVGMEIPSVVRWPFEKICFYNQKSVFWRVHSSLYQLPEEIRMRGNAIKEDPLTFLKKQ